MMLYFGIDDKKKKNPHSFFRTGRAKVQRMSVVMLKRESLFILLNHIIHSELQ